MTNLKPCPACGGKARRYGGNDYAECENMQCRLFGPNHDTDGAKWNALPRREDARRTTTTDPSGMRVTAIHLTDAERAALRTGVDVMPDPMCPTCKGSGTNACNGNPKACSCRKPATPAQPANQPEVLWTGEVGCSRYEAITEPLRGQCAGCAAYNDATLCDELSEAHDCYRSHTIFRLATQPQPVTAAAPERVCGDESPTITATATVDPEQKCRVCGGDATNIFDGYPHCQPCTDEQVSRDLSAAGINMNESKKQFARMIDTYRKLRDANAAIATYQNTMGRMAIALFGESGNNVTDEECIRKANDVRVERDNLRAEVDRLKRASEIDWNLGYRAGAESQRRTTDGVGVAEVSTWSGVGELRTLDPLAELSAEGQAMGVYGMTAADNPLIKK